ncbi:hypothetical protein [Desulfitobacterium dehalogenans]|uniref:hypothetical protein n=1 Tax=Desulfitobacterium dehalogenans TaxID=36854 RepID=UPI0002FB328B|nr:hypothetical protein [Desulfitobacterium dehalogenans]
MDLSATETDVDHFANFDKMVSHSIVTILQEILPYHRRGYKTKPFARVKAT